MDKLLLGIDFGTSTNFVTRYDFKKKDAVPVENMAGYGKSSNVFDNCIYVENNENYVLGSRKKAYSDPENFFEDIKRFIIDDNWKKKIPNLGNKMVSAQDIAQMIFKAIRKKVEENQNQKIDGVVITVPYSYNNKYRERIKEAAENAGLKVIKLVEEPVAAAISYGIFGDQIQNNKKEKIAVFDLGGGTFDITIFSFEKSDNQNAKIEVLNTDGVEKLGGKNIDELLAKKLMEFLKVNYSDFTNQRERVEFQNKLNNLAKDIKENLSQEDEYEIYENFTVNGKSIELEKDITVDYFNDLLKNNNFIGQIEDALERAIYDIDLEPSDINRVVLAGGTSNIPLIKKTVEDFFGIKTEAKKSLGELVGHGAGILAGLSEDESLNYTVIRKTSKNIGVARGNKFFTILSKNFKYGEESPKYKLGLKNPKEELTISFYEGDAAKIEDCEKIGKTLINGNKFKNGIVYISLVKEDKSDSQIRCYLYDEDKNLVFDDYLTDV